MDLGIEGRVALVLGAAGGLGSAIAQRLHQEGAQVALADRDAGALAEVAGRVDPSGSASLQVPWDLADLDAIDGVVDRIESSLGPVDIVVNNTGGPPPGPLVNVPTSTWTAQFNSMVLPVVALTSRVLPHMRDQRWGRIVTSTSSGVLAPIPNLGLSNSLRSALIGWSKTLAGELGPDGITSNIVVPGRIATPRVEHLDEQKAARDGSSVVEVRQASVSAIPLARYGRPEEYADAVAFLCSDRASYITGSIVRVDGGYVPAV